MGLTMSKIINRFDDCNKFSLTGKVSRYNVTISQEEYENKTKKMNPREINKYMEQFIEKYTITEEEFYKALDRIEEHSKETKRKFYKDHKDKFVNYPEFDVLYDEIKQECIDFDCEENREFYINKFYNDKDLEEYRQIGITEEEINEMKNDFFHCSFIADNVGKTTKYGKENIGFFWNLYHDIAMMIDRQNDKKRYCISNGKSPLEQIPEELKEHFLYYEISYFNSVTISGGLMINYYFNLNEDTKKYLLQFRNDFCMRDLEDLTLYKDDEMKFYSCTHEGYNSIEIDYKNMSNDEIIDFINDEYYEEDNDEIIEIVNKLINMEVGNKFSFKEIGITSKMLMDKICYVSGCLNLILVFLKDKEHNYSKINADGDFEKVDEIPAFLCNVDDVIVKQR